MTTPSTAASSPLEGSLKDSAVARLLLGQKLSDVEDGPTRQRSTFGRQFCKRKVESGQATASTVNGRQTTRNCLPGRWETLPADRELTKSAHPPAIDLTSRRTSEPPAAEGRGTDKFNRMLNSIQQTVETLRAVIASELDRLRRYSPPGSSRDRGISEPGFCQLCQYAIKGNDLGKVNMRDTMISHYRQHESQLVGKETALDSNTVFGWFNYYTSQSAPEQTNSRPTSSVGVYDSYTPSRKGHQSSSKSRHTGHTAASTPSTATLSSMVPAAEESMAVLKELLLRPSSRVPALLKPASSARQRSISLAKIQKMSLNPCYDSTVVRSASAHGEFQGEIRLEVRPSSEEGVEPTRVRNGSTMLQDTLTIKQEPPPHISSPISPPQDVRQVRNERQYKPSNVIFTSSVDSRTMCDSGQQYTNGCNSQHYSRTSIQIPVMTPSSVKYNIDDLIRQNIAKCNAERDAQRLSHHEMNKLQRREYDSPPPLSAIQDRWHRRRHNSENRNQDMELSEHVNTSKQSIDNNTALLRSVNTLGSASDSLRFGREDLALTTAYDPRNQDTLVQNVITSRVTPSAPVSADRVQDLVTGMDFDTRKRSGLTNHPDENQNSAPSDGASFTPTYKHKRFGKICAPSVAVTCSDKMAKVILSRPGSVRDSYATSNLDRFQTVEESRHREHISSADNTTEENEAKCDLMPHLQLEVNQREYNRHEVKHPSFHSVSEINDHCDRNEKVCRQDSEYDVRITSCPVYPLNSVAVPKSESLSEKPHQYKSPIRKSQFYRSCSDSNVTISLSDELALAGRVDTGNTGGNLYSISNKCIVSERCKSIDSPLAMSVNCSTDESIENNSSHKLSQLWGRNLMQKFLDERIPTLLHESKKDDFKDGLATENMSNLRLKDNMISKDTNVLRQLRMSNFLEFEMNEIERIGSQITVRQGYVTDDEISRGRRDSCYSFSNEDGEEKAEGFKNVKRSIPNDTERVTFHTSAFEVLPALSAVERAPLAASLAKSYIPRIPDSCLLRADPHSSFVHGIKLRENCVSRMTDCEKLDYHKMLQIIASRYLSNPGNSDDINERKRKASDDRSHYDDEGIEGLKRFRAEYGNISTISELYDASIENILKQRYSESSVDMEDKGTTRDCANHNTSERDSSNLSEVTGASSQSESRTPATIESSPSSRVPVEFSRVESQSSPSSNQTNDSGTNGYYPSNIADSGVQRQLNTDQSADRCISIPAPSVQKHPSMAFNISSLISTKSEDIDGTRTADYNVSCKADTISVSSTCPDSVAKILNGGSHTYVCYSDNVNDLSNKNSEHIQDRLEGPQQRVVYNTPNSNENSSAIYKSCFARYGNDSDIDNTYKYENGGDIQRHLQNGDKISERNLHSVAEDFSPIESYRASSVRQTQSRVKYDQTNAINSTVNHRDPDSMTNNCDSLQVSVNGRGSANSVEHSRIFCDYTGRRCKPCGITFDDEVLHSIHMSCHSHLGPYVCNLCSKQCSTRYAFYTHILRGHHPV